MSPSSHKAWRDVLQALEHEETLKTLGRDKTRTKTKTKEPTQEPPSPTTFDELLEELEGTHGLEAIEKQHEADLMQTQMQNLGASKFHQAMTRGLGENGRDFVQRVAIAGGLIRHYPACASDLLANFAAARLLEIYGSPEQRENYLRPLRTGAFSCQFAGPAAGENESPDRFPGPLYLALRCEEPASSGEASGEASTSRPRLFFFPTARPHSGTTHSSTAWQLVGQDEGRARDALPFLHGMHAVTRLMHGLALAERLCHGLQRRLQQRLERHTAPEAETARDESGDDGSEATVLLEDDIMAVRVRMEALRMGLAMTALHQEVAFHHHDTEWRDYSRRVGVLLYAVASRWARHEAGVFFQIGCAWGVQDDELKGLVDILRSPWTGGGHAVPEMERTGVHEKHDLDLYLERMHVLVNRMNQHGGKAMALVRARLAHAIDTLDASSHALWTEEGETASETKNGRHPEHALRPRQDACRRALLTHQFGIVLGAEMLARLFVYHHARHEADQNPASDTNQDKKETRLFWTRMACYYATRNLPDADALALQGGGTDAENADSF